jgi:hypothetical protein
MGMAVYRKSPLPPLQAKFAVYYLFASLPVRPETAVLHMHSTGYAVCPLSSISKQINPLVLDLDATIRIAVW